MRADLIWLGCLGTDEFCQEHAKTIGDYMSHGKHVMFAAALYTNITIRTDEKMDERRKRRREQKREQKREPGRGPAGDDGPGGGVRLGFGGGPAARP